LLGGSRLRVSMMDTHTPENVKPLLSPRQSRGITCFIYGPLHASSIPIFLAKYDRLEAVELNLVKNCKFRALEK